MKALIKHLDFLFRYRVNFTLRRLMKIFKPINRKTYKIYFYPEIPHRKSAMYKICLMLGIKIVNKPDKSNDGLFIWEDKTFSEVYKSEDKYPIEINKFCNDISKEKVDKVFYKSFGYSLNVDPLKFNGECVIKSNENAQHDGKIISCPIDKTMPNCVYQLVLDNFENENLVKDIRVPIIGKEIPLVYFKFKEASLRFTNEIKAVQVHPTNEVFSSEEINSIISFCKEMKVDYAELDVIRNNNDGKIYIVDVNKTPWGPPAGISNEDSKYVIKEFSKSFNKNFLV